jgi:hypothetical protein
MARQEVAKRGDAARSEVFPGRSQCGQRVEACSSRWIKRLSWADRDLPNPPSRRRAPIFACDLSFYCTIDVKGAVTSAGIATLQTLPDVPPGDANLIAPRGTVDAGAAGIRVSGNLNVAALQVTNVFNIQAQGTATGIPMTATPNIGFLTNASNIAGQAAAAATEAANQSRSRPVAQDLPSIITVEVIGYGGDAGPSGQDLQGQDRHRKQDEPSQNPNSAVRVLGYGDLTEEQKRALTQDERNHL